MPITYGSVCSGIESATVAWHPLVWQAAWYAEIEPFPSAVLAHHYPETPNHGDMTRLAAMVLAKRGYPITQNGKRLTDANIDTLLLTRHAAKKARRGGYRLKGPSKRTAEQDKDFQAALRRLIEDAHTHCTG